MANTPGEGHAALLAAGKLEGACVFKSFEIKVDSRKRLAHANVDFVFVESHVTRAEGDVVVNRGREKLTLGVLENNAHLRPCDVGFFFIGDVFALHEHAAAGGFQDAVHVLDKGRFSRSGMAGNADELSFRYGESCIVQRPDSVGVAAPLRLLIVLLRAILLRARSVEVGMGYMVEFG